MPRSNFISVLSGLLFVVSLLLLSWQLFTPVPEVKVVAGYDKIYHAAGFTWLSLTAYMASLGKFQYWPTVAVVLCLYGVTTEVIQHFIPGRGYSTFDWLADWSGVLIICPLIIKLFNKLIALSRT